MLIMASGFCAQWDFPYIICYQNWSPKKFKSLSIIKIVVNSYSIVYNPPPPAWSRAFSQTNEKFTSQSSDVHNNRVPHSDRHCIRMESWTGQYATDNRSINHYPSIIIINCLTFSLDNKGFSFAPDYTWNLPNPRQVKIMFK